MGAEAAFSYENDNPYQSVNNFKPPVIRTGKLFLVDLAGSERIHKSGAYRDLTFLLYKIVVVNYIPKAISFEVSCPYGPYLCSHVHILVIKMPQHQHVALE